MMKPWQCIIDGIKVLPLAQIMIYRLILFINYRWVLCLVYNLFLLGNTPLGSPNAIASCITLLPSFLHRTDNTRASQVPTRPFGVVSDAPIIGAGPQMVLVDGNQYATNRIIPNTSFSLIGHDTTNTNALLQYTIQTLPNATTCGQLMDVNGEVITVVMTDLTSPNIAFIATTSFVSEPQDDCYFTYRVTQLSPPFHWCEANVVLVSNTIRQPVNQSITTNEGTAVVIPLGAVGTDGVR
jgi:hypothetical protein